MDRLERQLKALADKTRIAMLALLLKEKELCVCHFMDILELTQSKASRHLRYMYNAGLLKDRQEGVWVHYRISDHLDPASKTIVDSFKKLAGKGTFKELYSRLKKLKIKK